MKRFVFIVIFFVVFSSTTFLYSEERTAEVFKVMHGDIEALYSVLEQMKSPEGKVTMHSFSGSVIVVDYPDKIEEMRSILVQLDMAQKQVEIKVLIAEVSSAFLKRVGIGPSQTIIDPEEFHDVRYIMKASGEVAIRSEMAVKTLSGHPAAIQVSANEIFGPQIISSGGATVITPPPQIISAGDSLEVLPKVNNDGTITVSLRPSKSRFEARNVVSERSLLTQVVIASGETIVIGGYTLAEDRNREGRVPFTDTSISTNSLQERKIMMFLTAVIS